MRSIATLVVLATILAACAGGSPSSRTAQPDAEFLSIPLTDVRTGEAFTLGGFDGKITFFIAMAVW